MKMLLHSAFSICEVSLSSLVNVCITWTVLIILVLKWLGLQPHDQQGLKYLLASSLLNKTKQKQKQKQLPSHLPPPLWSSLIWSHLPDPCVTSHLFSNHSGGLSLVISICFIPLMNFDNSISNMLTNNKSYKSEPLRKTIRQIHGNILVKVLGIYWCLHVEVTIIPE